MATGNVHVSNPVGSGTTIMSNPVIPIGFGNVHVFETLNVDGDVTINGALNATVPPPPPSTHPSHGMWMKAQHIWHHTKRQCTMN